MSDLKNTYIAEFFESTFMYFRKTFLSLNMKLFRLVIPLNIDFEIYAAYSYDGQNYSNFRPFENYEDKVIDNENNLYVCFWLKRIIDNDLVIPTKLYDKQPSDNKYQGNFGKIENVRQKTADLILKSIFYNGQELSSEDIDFQEYFQIINEFPRWNFYDNQLVTIQRWLSTCNSIAEMYGHTCIYFKTEPLEFTEKNPYTGIHGTHHQIANNVIRNVIDIKKLHILFPNNELPNDRNIYTDWDMPLQDDVMIHIVRQKFEQAFGYKAIPQEKDYIYLPLLNKLFRVSTMQPKNGFMGVVGWYEVFLSKYEEDECVLIDKALKDSLSGIDDLTETRETSNFEKDVKEGLNQLISDKNDMLWDELNKIKSDTIYTEQDIDKEVVEEQKVTNQNYTNKLEDNTFYVSLKETEKLREFYDKRLEIVSVNPEDSLFPITMYDCSKVTKRTVALQYLLTDYSEKNKFSNICSIGFELTFNFILRSRFNGELFDIINGNGLTGNLERFNVVSTISIKNKQINLFDTGTQSIIVSEYKFDENELYQFSVEFTNLLNQYSFKIFKLKNRQKTLVYQNIYKLKCIFGEKEFDSNKYKVTNLQLFGGNYFVNDIVFKVDGKKFLEDNCLPLLNMYKF